MQQTKIYFPLIFISLEDDSSIVIPPQPTSPGEIMSGGEGEPVEADAPAKDETFAFSRFSTDELFKQLLLHHNETTK